MTPRWMRQDDEKAVRRLYEIGHPRWPPRPAPWYFAYPTLVVEQTGEIVGFTSFSLGHMTGMLMLHGQDMVVAPDARGQGLGFALHQARLRIGRAMGATMFAGFTTIDNAPMQGIFLACGHHRCQTIPRYYPDGKDAILYLGELTE